MKSKRKLALEKATAAAAARRSSEAGVKRSREHTDTASAPANHQHPSGAVSALLSLVASVVTSPLSEVSSPLEAEEFNSADDRWLDDLTIGEDGMVLLRWTQNADLSLRAPYRGDSRSTSFRKLAAAKEEAEAIAHSMQRDAAEGRKQTSLASYGFVPVPKDASDMDDDRADARPRTRRTREQDYEEDNFDGVLSVDECLALLEESGKASVSSNRKFNIQSNYEHLRFLAIHRYFTLLKDTDDIEPMGKMEASRQATLIFSCVTKDYLSRCIRVWADYYSLHRELPKRKQGTHAKTVSFIADADNFNALLQLLRSIPRNTRTAEAFAQRVTEKFPHISICSRTATDWMHRLGFHPGGLHSTVYKDGHERADVLNDRTVFISTMEALFPRMPTFSGSMMLEVIPPDPSLIGPGEKPILWFVHDESICDSSGGRIKPWIEVGHPPMQPKRGSSIMISGFLSPFGMQPADYVTMEPGKDKDGYWTNRDLIAQLHAWLPTIAERFPGYQAVIQFDNSANHGVYAPDALIANRLNLSDGYPELTASDKEAGMVQTAFRNTVWKDSSGTAHVQSFLYTDGTMDHKDPTRPAHKGIKTILEERGLWREQTIPGHFVRLKATGALAVGEEGPTIQPGTRVWQPGNRMLLEEALQVLEQQPDFVAQSKKNWVTEIVEQYGHIAVFGAKFHPELAAIEYFWGQTKKYLRRHCDYTFDTLRRALPEAIASVTVTTIRRHYAHVRRYMRAYADHTLSLEQIEWAMRKYSSHRRAKEPPATLDDEFLTPAWFADMPPKLRA
jgi:hypothetical protein